MIVINGRSAEIDLLTDRTDQICVFLSFFSVYWWGEAVTCISSYSYKWLLMW